MASGENAILEYFVKQPSHCSPPQEPFHYLSNIDILTSSDCDDSLAE